MTTVVKPPIGECGHERFETCEGGADDAGSTTPPHEPGTVPCAPIAHRDLHARLLERLPHLVAALGMDQLPDATSTTSRRWDEMDGCSPPNCPYVDDHVTIATGARTAIRLAVTEAYWNDDEIATASIRLDLRHEHPDQTTITITAHGSRTDGPVAWIDAVHVVDTDDHGDDRLASIVATALDLT